MTALELLAPADAEVLAFERERFAKSGRKADAILRRFGISETRYFQLVHSIAHKPAAMAYDPETGNRIRRLREARAQSRSATARGVTP